MTWELLAMWAIVIATVTWFVRDEKRNRADAELARAAAYYAHAPKYRHISAHAALQPALAPQPRRGGLSREQRAYLEALRTRS